MMGYWRGKEREEKDREGWRNRDECVRLDMFLGSR